MKWFLPLLVMLGSLAAAWWLMAAKQPLPTKPPEREPPLVQVVTPRPERIPVTVASQGVVAPRTEIDLIAEVPGKVIRIHRAFAAGGFFKPGEILVAIDPRDYDFAVVKAQAQVAEARKELAREQAEAEQAQREWQALGNGQPPGDYALHKPHLAERRAKLAAAEAELAEARLRRERCELRAPFAGRVRGKNVDVGQFATAGSLLARLYATDTAEVRLPIPASQMAFLKLPLSDPGGRDPADAPQVRLSAAFGAKTYRWPGRIVRTEGVMDDKTGMLYAVAEVRDPYRIFPDRPPLAVGLFVRAEIEGIERHDLLKLPDKALHSGYQIYVVDSQRRLRRRDVEVLGRDSEGLLVAGSVGSGEQVMVSGVELPVDGMPVRTETGLAQSGEAHRP